MNEYQPQRNHQSDLQWIYKTQNVYEQKNYKRHTIKNLTILKEKKKAAKKKKQ